MLHLVKLELKKGGLRGYILGALIAYAAIAGLLMLMYFLPDDGSSGAPAFKDKGEIFSVVNTLVSATFIIYSASLLSRLIINEFKDRTMTLLFSYPVSRKQLIFAKLSVVFVWCCIAIVLGNVLLNTLMLVVNAYAGKVVGVLSAFDWLRQFGAVTLQAIGAAGMSLLSLVIGLKRRSVSATIVSSIFIVAIVCSNNFGFSLSSIIAIPLSLATIGIIGAYLSFRNIDQVDVA